MAPQRASIGVVGYRTACEIEWISKAATRYRAGGSKEPTMSPLASRACHAPAAAASSRPTASFTDS